MKHYQLGLYEKAMPGTLSWREKLKTAKRAGFDFVEISIDESDEKLARLDMSTAERMALVREMSEAGLPIRSMCLSGHRKYPLGSSDPAVCTRSIEIMEKAVRLAADLGVRIIQLAGYDVYYEDSTPDTAARFLENLSFAAMLAAQSGALLGFETMETPFMNTVEKAMRYVKLVDSPYLQVYPDAGNLTNAAVASGSDVCADLRTGAGHLIAMHLKETMPGVFREVPFGTGHVDFKTLIKQAWSLGVRRYVAECWYTGSPDWEQDLALAQKLLSGCLNKEDLRC